MRIPGADELVAVDEAIVAREVAGTRNAAAEVTVGDGDSFLITSLCILVPVEPGVLSHQLRLSSPLTRKAAACIVCTVFLHSAGV